MQSENKKLDECLETLVQLENRICEIRKSKLQRLLQRGSKPEKETNFSENSTAYYLDVGDL